MSLNSNEVKIVNESCSHSNITPVRLGGSVCLDCGVELVLEYNTPEYESPEWRNFSESNTDQSRCFVRRVQDRNIITELEVLNIDKKLIDETNNLYLSITKNDILRGSSRKGVIFACLFYIYKLKNNPKTPEELNSIINIPKKVISKGMKYYNLRASKEQKQNTYIDPIHFIPSIIDKLNNFKHKNKQIHLDNEDIKNINNLYKEIEHKSTLLNRSNPQSVACGLVFYYCQLKNNNINCYQFSKMVLLSDITIGKICKNITILLNENK